MNFMHVACLWLWLLLAVAGKTCVPVSFFQHEVTQEDEDTNVHEDEPSLSISELPPEYLCGDSLMVDGDYRGELDVDSCIPR